MNFDGSGITALNILEKCFDAYTAVRSKARGKADTIVMSFKHLGSVLKILEGAKGGFKVSPTSNKANVYAWTEIVVNSVSGELKIVACQEIDDDIIMLLDFSAIKFYSLPGLFKKRVSPDGKEFFEERAVTGYRYIVDLSLVGDLVVTAPNRCGIIFGIPNY